MKKCLIFIVCMVSSLSLLGCSGESKSKDAEKTTKAISTSSKNQDKDK